MRADVVVAGYGPAGACAAIAAHDAGHSVLVVESAERGGGNARYSGGFLFDVPGPAAAFEEVRSRQALPRTLVPGDVAATVAFLASDGAAALTGQTLCTDGGLILR
jgi:glycine/D-amino acid oxidase-like deaminating enzyme